MELRILTKQTNLNSLKDGGFGCCPMPSAVCCKDGTHCCAHGTTCNLEKGTCDSVAVNLVSEVLKMLAIINLQRRKGKRYRKKIDQNMVILESNVILVFSEFLY